MSFNTALSGLNAATADLNVKSNNIANVNTTGFKESRAEFGDVFAVSAFGTTSKTAIGSGVVLQNVAQQFNQGNLEFTENALDLAISGEGFFAMAPTIDSGEVIYTRAGEFGINKDGFIVNSLGNFLRTFPIDADGNISATSMSAARPLQLPPTAGAPESTSLLSIATNLPSNASPISNTALATPATAGTDTINFSTGTISAGDTVTVNGVVFTFADATTASTVDSATAVTVNVDFTGGATQQNASDAFVSAFTAAVTDTGATGTGSALSGLSAANGGGLTATITDTAAGLALTVGRTVTASDATVSQNVTGSDATTGPILAINPLDPTTYTNSTSATVFDSLGNEHIVTTYYQKIDAESGGVGDNQWQMEMYISSDDIKVTGTTNTVTDGATTLVKLGATTRMGFNSDGTLNSTIPDPITMTFAAASGTELASGAADQTITLSLAGSTQNSGSFSVGGLTVNGFPTGRLTGVDISEDGLIRATFSNGQAIPIGKIALGNFANVQALNKIGNTAWKETTDSGPVIAGEAGTGSFGQIQSGALETSNVDLTKELVGLITAQRNFQANSKAIETNNAITQTIINLR
ncbi:MAG: flagellar hook protein FlgE [Gammaproteobacteria bacterium]|nr:flagellar hook protein FlgE [Gammaproteobacteria bacterium]